MPSFRWKRSPGVTLKKVTQSNSCASFRPLTSHLREAPVTPATQTKISESVSASKGGGSEPNQPFRKTSHSPPPPERSEHHSAIIIPSPPRGGSSPPPTHLQGFQLLVQCHFPSGVGRLTCTEKHSFLCFCRASFGGV